MVHMVHSAFNQNTFEIRKENQ